MTGQTKILGLSFFYHDSAAALVVDGTPVWLAQEERFSRKKHDSEFPERSVRYILQKSGLQLSDIDYVVFYEKPFPKFERIIKSNLLSFPRAPYTFSESTKALFSKKLWLKDIISQKLNYPADKILFSEHHLSHAASVFFCSPYEESAILTVDGVGELATTTISRARGNNIEILKEIHFPNSLGLLYSTFTAFLGYEVNEGEYKVMGLSPYGQPRYTDQIKKMIRFFDDGSYVLDLRYFQFHRSTKRMYSERFIKEFGQDYNRADIAASIQSVLEEALLGLAKEAYRITGSKNLCLAGGVALNSVANWKIQQNTPFKNIFIQPAAGDAGAALGAALAVHHLALNKPRQYVMRHAYYGSEYSDEAIKTFLDKEHIHYDHIADEDHLLNITAEAITAGKVVGWFHGRSEWGPRALGARSILADPRRADMKELINKKIKFREPYRPFAPSIQAEEADKFFELPETARDPARFMLYVLPVREKMRDKIPAVTHVDGSARPQLVFPEDSPRYHRLINTFYIKTGVPLLLNTSFNLKGEPIVDSPEDAYSTFIRSGLDLLVLENFIISKK